MKIFSCLKFTTAVTVALVVGVVTVAAAPPSPISNVQVTLKGKKYQIDEPVTTVAELQERLEEQSGISPSKQGKILHQGKRLSSSSTGSLSEAGVSEGDQLNCVPSKKSTSSTKKKSTSTASSAAVASTTVAPPAAAAAGGAGAGGDSLADMMKGLGLGGGAPGGAPGGGGLDDMIQKMMMGGGGSPGEMPDMKESMTMLKQLTDSPMFSEYMSDPAKLEEARQMILTNPMMKGMMASMPGMSELLDDKEAWVQAMTAAASIMKSMDSDDMIKMMEAQAGGSMPPGMGGMGGMGGMDTAGLFDGGMGAAAASSSTALDELSEGED